MNPELVKPDFIAGSEKRFADFISNLKDKDKIALISHQADLDGIAAAKIANFALGSDAVKLINYEDIDESLVRWLAENKINKAVFTDLRVDDLKIIKNIETFCEILLIDHHKMGEDYNSRKTVFLNAQEFCAGYLAYYLFSITQDFNLSSLLLKSREYSKRQNLRNIDVSCYKAQNLEKLDWLAACSCVSDFCHKKPAEWLKKVFEKYGDRLEFDGFYVRKSGIFWDIQYKLSLAIIYFRDNVMKVYDSIGENFGDIGNLGKYAQEVDSYINECIEKFEKEKIAFNDGYFWEIIPRFKVGSIVSTITSSKYPSKTVIIARAEEDKYHFSARRQDKEQDMDLLIKSLISGLSGAIGGGHIAAGGGHVMLKDKNEFKKRLGVVSKK